MEEQIHVAQRPVYWVLLRAEPLIYLRQWFFENMLSITRTHMVSLCCPMASYKPACLVPQTIHGWLKYTGNLCLFGPCILWRVMYGLEYAICQKFSSNVIEQLLVHSNAEERAQLFLDLGQPAPMDAILKDRFGNYAVQKALALSEGTQYFMPLLRSVKKVLDKAGSLVCIRPKLLKKYPRLGSSGALV